MYRIFHGKHVLILSKKKDLPHDVEPDFVFKKPHEEQIKQVLSITKKARKSLVIFLTGKPEHLLDLITDEFKLVEAAGGLVFNSKDELLLMKRLGKWDLPKGKIKKGETLADCAVREVEEETGAQGLSILQPIAETYHTYFRNEKWQLKRSYWYLMACSKGKNLVPQLEEDITEVRWVPSDSLHFEEHETYPAIHWLISHYKELLQKAD